MTVHTPGGPLTVNRNVPVDPGGWIKVPRLNDFTRGGQGWFVGGSEVDLVDLDTTKLTSESFDLISPPPVLEAGQSVPAAKKSRKHRFRLFFEARIVGGANVSSNDREKIAFSNTSYRQRRHPHWPENSPDPTLLGVVSLDIAELGGPGGGCQHLHNDLHALFDVMRATARLVALPFRQTIHTIGETAMRFIVDAARIKATEILARLN